jgi:hypothetical protein
MLEPGNGRIEKVGDEKPQHQGQEDFSEDDEDYDDAYEAANEYQKTK